MELGEKLDHQEASGIREELLGSLKKGAHVTLNLARVNQLDTAGIALLIEGARRAKDLGACLSLGEVSDAARSALEVARIDKLFPPDGEVH